MENNKDINAQIFELTLHIEEKYPELYTFLNEMPATIPAEKDPEINLKNLTDYFNSLKEMLEKYTLEHPELKN